MKRDGMSREDLILRLKAQYPLKEKVKYADYLIENTSSLDALETDVGALFEKIIAP